MTNVITKPKARAMFQLKLTQVGNSIGVILPKEILARLNVDKGDTVFLTETPGGFAVTPYDGSFEDQMTVMRDVMKKRRGALRELAK